MPSVILYKLADTLFVNDDDFAEAKTNCPRLFGTPVDGVPNIPSASFLVIELTSIIVAPIYTGMGL